MHRALASIQTIDKLEPIPGADRIELAHVLGWKVIVKKGEFQTGDKVVYVEVDSVLPEDSRFKFLRKCCYINRFGLKGFRIKTIKMKGVISQGIVFPITILPDGDYPIGSDVTSVIGITKYEIPDISTLKKPIARGTFPRDIPKTDEIRVQSIPDVLVRHAGKEFYATEKFDGTSMTVFWDLDTGLHVCSRNLDLAPDKIHPWNGSAYWYTAKKYHLDEVLHVLGDSIALQGELIGSGIQGNKYDIKNDYKFIVFNMWDIANRCYIDRATMEDAVKDLSLGIELVPRVYDFVLDHEVDDIVDLSKGNSRLADIPREGIVIRPWKEQFDQYLGRLSFKAINPDFLIQFDE